MRLIPTSVLRAYGLDDAHVTPIDVGLINQTYEVAVDGTPRFVLQRLHEIFAGEVCLDLEAIAGHVAAAGLVTPQLVRTRSAEPFVEAGDGVWRVITFVPGRTLTAVTDPRHAYEAARLASRFHAAVADLSHTFHFTRAGVHDTAAHLGRLEDWAQRGEGHTEHAENRAIAESILEHARSLAPLPPLPTRIVHGDLKISNVRFDASLEQAIALLDLDTLAHGTMAFELGDALRSWAQRGSENAEDTRAEAEIVRAALRGYAAGGFALSREEREAIVLGLETVSTELAARFAVDAWEDRYFGWDASRYASRRDHDRARARSQLSLARSVRRERAALEAIAHDALTR